MVTSDLQTSNEKSDTVRNISQNIAPMIGNMKEGKGTMGNSLE